MILRARRSAGGEEVEEVEVELFSEEKGVHMSIAPGYPLAADGPAVVGPMPTITDSLFSLIIFIYVMITFLYLFYGFCWVEPPKLTEEQKKELAKQAARKARPMGPPE